MKLHHLCQLLLDSSLFLPPSYRLPSLAVCRRLTLCINRYPLPLPARNAFHLDVIQPRPPLASAARLCNPHRIPASYVVPFMFAPPLPDLACAQVSDSLLRFARPCPSVLLVFFFNLPYVPYLPGIFWRFFSWMGVQFRTRARGQGASILRAYLDRKSVV